MPTRLYLSRLTSAPAAPAFAGWGDSSLAVSKKLLQAKDAAESLATVVFNTDGSTGAGGQFVSDPLTAQTISGSVKAYARIRDASVGGLAFTNFYVSVVSGDGGTVRGVLLSLGSYGSGLPLAALMNRAFADGDSVSAVAAEAGDRLVVEFGANDANAGTFQLNYGAPTGSDLPEDEITTTALTPWVEFSGAIGFQSVSASGAPNILLLGVG